MFNCYIEACTHVDLKYALVVYLSFCFLVYVSINESGDQLVGQPYTLTCQVNAGGHTVMSAYQWIKDGTEITDETSETLPFSSLADTDSGDYICRVTVSHHTSTSASVTIGVGKRMRCMHIKKQILITDHFQMLY